LDVRDLTTFAMVARLESFSRAAIQSRIAQSALSRRVQRLERQLGVPLLERHARGVRPTSAGLVLLKRVDGLEKEISDIEAEIAKLRPAAAEELRLAMPHGATKLFGSEIIERFQSVCPDIRLLVLERGSLWSRDSVIRGEVDAGMVYEPAESSELTITPLLAERLLVVGPARSSKSGEAIPYPESYDAADLATLPLILPALPHGYRRAIERIVASVRKTPNVVFEVEGLPALATLVEHGLGYMISTYAPVRGAIDAGALVAVPIRVPRCEVELALVHRRDREITRGLASLKTVVEQVVNSLGSTGHLRPTRQASPG
jgi:LysR family transcriptional regulator, nitrogen assimilation regulatory protein